MTTDRETRHLADVEARLDDITHALDVVCDPMSFLDCNTYDAIASAVHAARSFAARARLRVREQLAKRGAVEVA